MTTENAVEASRAPANQSHDSTGNPNSIAKMRGLAADFQFGEISLDNAFALMRWVERARATLDRMYDLKKVLPDLDAILRAYDVPMDGDWGQAESNGLIDLMMRASGTASQLCADGADLARAAVKGMHRE